MQNAFPKLEIIYHYSACTPTYTQVYRHVHMHHLPGTKGPEPCVVSKRVLQVEAHLAAAPPSLSEWVVSIARMRTYSEREGKCDRKKVQKEW